MAMLPIHETDLPAFDAHRGGAFAELLRSSWRARQVDGQSGEYGCKRRGGHLKGVGVKPGHAAAAVWFNFKTQPAGSFR